MQCQKEGGVTSGGNFQEGLKEVRELALRTSVGGFSGKGTIGCKYLSEEAASLECLRDSEKPEWLEREQIGEQEVSSERE